MRQPFLQERRAEASSGLYNRWQTFCTTTMFGYASVKLTTSHSQLLRHFGLFETECISSRTCLFVLLQCFAVATFTVCFAIALPSDHDLFLHQKSTFSPIPQSPALITHAHSLIFYVVTPCICCLHLKHPNLLSIYY